MNEWEKIKPARTEHKKKKQKKKKKKKKRANHSRRSINELRPDLEAGEQQVPAGCMSSRVGMLE